MLKQKIKEINETAESDDEVEPVKDTTAITDIKNKIESKKEKLEKAIIKININIEAKNKKIEAGTNRLKTKKLSYDNRKKTENILIENNNKCAGHDARHSPWVSRTAAMDYDCPPSGGASSGSIPEGSVRNGTNHYYYKYLSRC